MNRLRTAIEASLLIAAWSSQSALFVRALAILEDPGRILIFIYTLLIEVIPKYIYHEHTE